jgi:hypothetical protein
VSTPQTTAPPPAPAPGGPSPWRLSDYISRETIAVVILFIIPVVAVAADVWLTRGTQPRVKTWVVINRNSLLPHRFAGTCENCHRVQEIGPVAMNRENMRLFMLRGQDRQLLLAGQRVDVPSIAQLTRMPAIWRSDPLPHTYVGVCSNCHIVLNVRPSDAVAAQAMRRAYQPLSSMDLTPEQLARAGAKVRTPRELYRNIWGFAALALLVMSCVYVVMRMLMKSYPARFKGKFDLKKWFTVHEWASLAFAVAAISHWYCSDRGNNLLHIALLVVIWLTVAGLVLRYRMTQQDVRKDVRLLHTQRGLFFGLLALLIIGHFFAGYS